MGPESDQQSFTISSRGKESTDPVGVRRRRTVINSAPDRPEGTKVKLILALATLAVLPNQLSAATQVEETVHSFTNDPEILSPGFQVTADSWLLHFNARFANSCLADQGARILYTDLASRDPATGDAVRLVRVEQKLDPDGQGCPEIFNPVRRAYQVNMPVPATATSRLLLMDCREETPHRLSDLQLCSFDTREKRQRVQDLGVSPPIKALAIPDHNRLPVIRNIGISIGERTPSTEMTVESIQYSLRFEVVFPSVCHSEKGIEIEVIESRTGVSDVSGVPVLEWLSIVNRNSSNCKIDREVIRHYQVVRQARVDYRRSLVIINPAAPPDTSADFFVVKEILM